MGRMCRLWLISCAVHRVYGICTQGPVKYSCMDFWRMVWEQHASGIVMLNQIHELVGSSACIYNIYTVYLKILAVIKFGDLPEICPKCNIGGI